MSLPRFSWWIPWTKKGDPLPIDPMIWLGETSQVQLEPDIAAKT